MKNEAERYKFVLEKSGLSKTAFARSVGISRSHNYHLERGTQKAPREVLERLASIYNVNLNWLIHGIGPSGLNSDIAEIELLDQEVAAGHGREVENYPEIHYFQVPFNLIRPHRPENLKAVYVSGDSMTEEHINDGDIVIFNTKQTMGNGIYVISVGNSLLVKRVDFDNNDKYVILISANPAYEPRRYSGLELDNIRVAGRVVACYHRVL
jgi:phage repressor protein C with HTH and peptisase S24 domain